ncbi:non-homologous end joining protein Ku [Nocardiopsis salina]|uniref:non-homologous end joining protein Ku n=1 Tax=Nocardiopsis salina TaxID=245836 RepID=UPI000349D0B5|nr:Ku protein [Nocardiopsis salina]
MANPVWTGTLSFGLVSMGARLYSARERHGPTTHQFVKGTSDRVRYKRVNESTGEPVSQDDIVKGAQYGSDRDSYVVLEPEELERIQPVRSKTLEVEGFVETASIDPLWYASTYYVGPDKGAAKPYRLLCRALTESGRAGLGRMVMRGREHLVLITPQQGVLTASTLYWPDEIREPEDVMRPPSGEVEDKDLELAEQLIEAMAADWEPSQYTDEYERRLEELIEAKAKGSTISYEPEEPEEQGKVVALDDALRRSLQERRGSKGGGKKSGGSQRAPAPRRSQEQSSGKSSAPEQRSAPTKKELMARAKELGVEGRSKMSRDELAEAVDRAG